MFSIDLKRPHASIPLDWSTLPLHTGTATESGDQGSIWNHLRAHLGRLSHYPLGYKTCWSTSLMGDWGQGMLVRLLPSAMNSGNSFKSFRERNKKRHWGASSSLSSSSEWHFFIWKKCSLHELRLRSYFIFFSVYWHFVVLCHLCLILWQPHYQADMYSHKWPETEKRKRQGRKGATDRKREGCKELTDIFTLFFFAFKKKLFSSLAFSPF